jgi:hypothetical protein
MSNVQIPMSIKDQNPNFQYYSGFLEFESLGFHYAFDFGHLTFTKVLYLPTIFLMR